MTPFPDYDETQRVTLSGKPAAQEGPAPQPLDATGMHGDYWVLSQEERDKGFVRPVRMTYKHLACGHQTTMNHAIAETYARDPKFYGRTFCYYCRQHLSVGPAGEFEWLDGTKVGS
jgi:hypothetical protein